MSEPAKVYEFPQREVCDPASGEVLSPVDAQHRLNALADEVGALTKALASAHRSNESLNTKLKKLREQQAEEDCDAEVVRDLVIWHYSRFGRAKHKRRIPLSGVDATIVRWLLNACQWEPRDVALMSVGFSLNSFYREKGMVSLMNAATTKIDGKRVKDEEKAWRFREAGVKADEARRAVSGRALKEKA